MILLIVVGVIVIQFIPGSLPYEEDEYRVFDSLPSTPTLYDIQPDPDTDDVINLYWSSSFRAWYYNVYRCKSDGAEQKIGNEIIRNSFVDSATKENGDYSYRIEAVNNIGRVWSNTETVTIYVSDINLIPSNPSIIINDDGSIDGANATNSLEVILTLSCDDADEMCFQISEDIWINWIVYETTYTITLLENDTWAPNYRVGVMFRNNYGETSVVCDDIIYDPEEPPPPPPPDKDEEDYILLFILLGVLGGLIGIVVFLKFGKKGKKSN